MKKIFSAAASLLLLLSLFTGCALFGSTKPGTGTPEPGETASMPPASNAPHTVSPDTKPSAAGDSADAIEGIVAIETENYAYQSDYIDVTVDVPRLEGLADSAIQASVNARFSDILKTAQEDVGPAEKESIQLAEDRGETIPYMIAVSFSVPYNYNGILCIVFSDYRYLGGAHGGDFRTAYTFDLTTGKELALSDLMLNDSGYRTFINSTIKKEIERRVESGELYELVTFEDIGDTPAFYLTQNATVFYFQEYEYFPYASGLQEFPIMYADMDGMLKTEYAALSLTQVVLDTSAGNTLATGDIGQVSLNGNPTTGYSWHYMIGDTSVLELSRDHYQSDTKAGEVGAGGRYTWDFRALKAGSTTITFKYYRDWLGESDTAPEDIIEYAVTVK